MIERAIRKAQKSKCRHKVLAIGFNKSGDVVGMCNNIPRFREFGGSIHAEINLIHNYGYKLRSILIIRVGKSGQLLPIHPCKNCAKVLKKLNIKVKSVSGVNFFLA